MESHKIHVPNHQPVREIEWSLINKTTKMNVGADDGSFRIKHWELLVIAGDKRCWFDHGITREFIGVLFFSESKKAMGDGPS